jgi:hypothetical protein
MLAQLPLFEYEANALHNWTQLSLDDAELELVRPWLVVVVPCSGEKKVQNFDTMELAWPAGELYLGSFHRYARTHADRIEADEVLILSASAGLLTLDRVLPPYDTKITDKDSIVSTPGKLAHQAEARGLNESGVVVVSFCPAAYTAALRLAVRELVSPLEGSRGIGEQRGRLARLTRESVGAA